MKIKILLFATFIAMTCASAIQAQGIKRCVDADGKVTFTDQPCPSAEGPSPAKADVAASSSSTSSTTGGNTPPAPPAPVPGKSRYVLLDNGSTVLDTRTNLVWKRCQEGKRWENGFCKGIGKKFSWTDALRDAPDGWRVPTITELKGLATPANKDGVWIDNDVFPDTDPDTFWSSSPSHLDSGAAWDFNFGKGHAFAGANRTYKSYVRWVRTNKGALNTRSDPLSPPGTQTQASTRYARYVLTNNGEAVLDQKTGLLWKRCQEGKRLIANACEGNGLKAGWYEAKQAGSAGWRLPEVGELKSLVEMNAQGQARINEKFFPNTNPDEFWSSSPSDTNPGAASAVDFGSGYDSGNVVRYTPGFIRLVKSAR